MILMCRKKTLVLSFNVEIILFEQNSEALPIAWWRWFAKEH